MPVTKDELDSFNQFVDEKIASGGAGSLRELVAEWEHQKERQEVNEAIRRGLADVDAGRTEPFLQSQDEFRQERGLPPRK